MMTASQPWPVTPALFQQMVHIVHDAESLRDRMRSLGYTKWMEDTCIQQGVVWNDAESDWQPFSSFARMFFNYEILPGTVFEIIEYDNESWLKHIDPHAWSLNKSRDMVGGPLLVMTQVVDDLQAFLRNNWLNGARMVQRYRTGSHTNHYLLKDDRWFDHAVFDTKSQLGYIMKAMEKKYGHAAA